MGAPSPTGRRGTPSAAYSSRQQYTAASDSSVAGTAPTSQSQQLISPTAFTPACGVTPSSPSIAFRLFHGL